MSGNKVSHAHNKTRRRFLPNLHDHRFWFAEEKRWIKLRISNKGLRLVEKKGLGQIVEELRKRGEKI